ncbi:nucleoid-associated protein YgaU [Kitasatospora sp. MAP12-15]|uniref:LysM peptidoglycan-binding domain-containing protein n=1 Tax=unclassified Kitasatospora TaxID=2633591 RepID=UPI0024741B31|nr:LysM peptidoglycan-binding domain-containing protein [Kitasatospora sp. MAP12-44]MDH6115640.1 nucleoid-associated protein YgaU [Kitasatospora sp. MAP12-44]
MRPPTHPRTRGRTGSRLAAALRAIAALVTLLALLAGVPALLWLFTTTLLPHGVSTADLQSLLTPQSNDVGTPFIAVLTAVGWSAWAGFTLCVLLEIPAQLTGRGAVRLPAFGAPQRLAALLVGAILILLPTGSALAAAAPASAATARPLVAATAGQHPASASVAQAATPTTPSAGAQAAQHRQYTVQDRDSLWSIAQHQLGDATRWKDIAQLNADRTMNDGTLFSADTIQPGWTLLLPDAPAGPGPTTVQGAQQQSPPSEARTTSQEGPASVGNPTAWPTHTVQSPTESPWDLAVSYLGDGQRWTDIAALNPTLPETAAGYLPQGAVINLPADARLTTAPAAPAAGATSDSTTSPTSQQQPFDAQATPSTGSGQGESHVTVHAGDSLWSIAQSAYGDPEQWPAIADANKGTISDPDLIHPGQQLTVPPPPGTAQTPAGTESPTRGTAVQPDTPSMPTATTGAGSAPTQSRPTPPAASPATPAPTRPAIPSPSAHTPSPAAPPDQVGGAVQLRTAQPAAEATAHVLAPAEVWLGAGALAAALVGAVALRRRLQQRRLPPGRHIPLPTGRAAKTEQSLRAAQHPAGFDLLDRSLRTLALNLADAGRELPIVEAVVLREARVELHLAADTAPMQPFTAAPGRTDLWTCSASSPDLPEDEALADAETPYPALVSIGWDTRGHLVLVDLEHIGILQLSGDRAFARHVLQALAVELATTPLPGHLEIAALGEAAPGLEAAAPERVARTADLAQGATALAAHTADQRRALAALGADSPRTARLGDGAGDSWTPHIVLAQQLAAGPDTDRLLEALAQQPRTSSAVIATGDEATFGGWTLICEDPDVTVLLPGSGLPIRLQGLSDEHFADAVEILTLASSEADLPAPAWITEPAWVWADEAVLDPTAVADADEDGLPAKHAALEDEALTDEQDAETDLAVEPDGSTAAAPLPVKTPAEPTEDQDDPDGGPTLADILAEDDTPPDTPAQHTWPTPIPTAPVPPPAAPAPATAVVPTAATALPTRPPAGRREAQPPPRAAGRPYCCSALSRSRVRRAGSTPTGSGPPPS